MQSKSDQHHKSIHTQKGEMERLIFNRLLTVCGILFLFVGLYLFVSSSNLATYIQNSIHSLLQPSKEHTKSIYLSYSYFNVTLYLYFLPAIAVLIASLYFAGKYRVSSFILIIIVSTYFLFVQTRLFINAYSGGCAYDNFYIASFFLIITTFLLIIAAYLHNSFILSVFTCIYFYFSTLLYVLSIDGHQVLFILIILFTLSTTLLSKKIRQPLIIIVNFILSIGYFLLYFSKKILVNHQSEFLPIFFIFGGLFYLLFYVIPIFSSDREEKRLSLGMQSVLSGLNLFFYLGTASFVLLKFYSYSSLCLFVPALLLVNVAGSYLIKKQAKHIWSLPYDYAVIFLSALILPVWIQDSKMLLFMGVVSLLMLVYSIREKSTASFWISVSALVIATVSYLLGFVSFVPAILFDHKTLHTYLLLKGILNSVFLMGLLWGTKWMLKDAVLPVSEKVLKPRRYVKIIDAFLLSGLFITIGLIIFLIPYFSTGSVRYMGLSWFISGSLFFIYFVRYFSGKKMALKKTVHYVGFVFAMLYPLVTTIRFLNYSGSKIYGFDYTAIFLHYIALVLLIVLSLMVLIRIRKRNKNNNFTLKLIQLLVGFYLLFIVFEEYNNLSMAGAFLMQNYELFESNPLFLSSNFYFPFTIILSLFATSVNIYAIIKQDTFLKIVSVSLIVIAILKLFILDKGTAPDDASGIIFIVAGVLLVILALLNSWLVNVISRRKSL